MYTRPPDYFRGVESFSIDTFRNGVAHFHTGYGAVVWGTQYRAVYVPLRVRQRVTVRKLWVFHGSTGTGDFDVGIYDAAGTRLVSTGSTAKTAATAVKVVDVTDTVVGPGLYYLALNADSATDTYQADSDPAPICASMGVLTETLGSVTLPATASWAADQTLALYPGAGAFVVTTVS